MVEFDKEEIKEAITMNQIYDLLTEWGGEPKRTIEGLVSRTICHGGHSHKLYVYSNTKLFRCYTGCDEPTFDIFELTRKVMHIQHGLNYSLNDAVRYIAQYIGYDGADSADYHEADWDALQNQVSLEDFGSRDWHTILPEYDISILDKFNYTAKIDPWLKEGIDQDVIDRACIGFYPGADQITIPHFDYNNRFIGLRGRFLAKEDCERWGKYLPLKIGNITYSHPTGMNLYGINWAKDNIARIKKVIVFEAEKSVLKFASYFGWDKNITVGCNGSNISRYHLQQVLDAGAEEMIIALDRQFQEIGDEEYIHLMLNLQKMSEKYKNDIKVSIIFDKDMLTNYKDSPIDDGPELFQKLYNERTQLY